MITPKLVLFGILAVAAFAQRPSPVQWSLSVEPASAAPGSEVLAKLTAKIDPGWHLYSLTTPAAIQTSVELEPSPAVESVRVYQPEPVTKLDPNFQENTETFDKEAVFLLAIRLRKDAAPGPVELTARTRYQVCDDRQCLLPVRRTATATLRLEPGAEVSSVTIPSGYREPGAGPASSASATAPAVPERQGFAAFLLVALGFGLAAVFTPCVFPMIPITMSFFLNRQGGGRRDSIFQASVFCLGIIVLFSSLGLAATAVMGPFGMIQLGSNPWVNVFISAVFFVFGLSLLGAFEITLPSSLLTRLDRASQKGGVAGTLLMGLTFSLTSFACVGPFVGTLLAASVQEGGMQPLFGMVAFATGLAAPFFFLALFPAYLQRMPKSGGWLARVKVVLGFVILAAMLKYLANVDQVLQWNFLTRERFLAAWFVLLTLPGLYLLGLLRLPGVRADEEVGVARILVAAVFLTFSLSLLPGMFGAPLGDLDAYVPVASGPGAFAGSTSGKSGPGWMKDQYAEALALAREQGKPLFVNFTGYACSNCHWMKANMFPRPAVAAALGNFVLVELYTDGRDEASVRNQELLEKKFSIAAIPYYAILRPDETVVATFPGLTRSEEEFLGFLKAGRGTNLALSR